MPSGPLNLRQNLLCGILEVSSMAQITGKSLRVKNARAPDETRKFEGKGHLDVLDFGDHKVGVATFEPGWKWSANVKPIAKTNSCQSAHLSYVISGRMKIVHD